MVGSCSMSWKNLLKSQMLAGCPIFCNSSQVVHSMAEKEGGLLFMSDQNTIQLSSHEWDKPTSG